MVTKKFDPQDVLEKLIRAARAAGADAADGLLVESVSSTDLSPRAVDELPERAVALARLAPEDKFAGLAPADRLAKTYPDLDIEDRG